MEELLIQDYVCKLRQELIDELKKKTIGLAWENFFPSIPPSEIKSIDIDNFIANADSVTLDNYTCRSQIIFGVKDIDRLLKFHKYKEIAFTLIDPLIKRSDEVSKIMGARDYRSCVVVVEDLSEIVGDKNLLGESDCPALSFKRDVRKNKKHRFFHLYKLSLRLSKYYNPNSKCKDRRTRKLMKNYTNENALASNVPTLSKPIAKYTRIDELPSVDLDLYNPLIMLLQSSLKGLCLMKNFNPKQIYSDLAVRTENFETWCKKTYPTEFPVILARNHLKVGVQFHVSWKKDIENDKIALVFIKPKSSNFPVKKISDLCYRKEVPIVPIEELRDIVSDSSTLNTKCFALGLKISVLNRKSGFYGLYKLACQAVNVTPKEELPQECPQQVPKDKI